MAGLSKFEPTQRARILSEICEREARATHKAGGTSAAPFSLTTRSQSGGFLPPKPNATRPDRWSVDEAAAELARARLAALAPQHGRGSGAGSSAASCTAGASSSNGGSSGGVVSQGAWSCVLPPSSNGEYGSHAALIDAALKEQQQQQREPSGSGSNATMLMTLQQMAGVGGTGTAAQHPANAAAAATFDLDNGRKSSSLTQFAAAYVAALGRSPFTRGRSASGGSGGAGKKGA